MRPMAGMRKNELNSKLSKNLSDLCEFAALTRLVPGAGTPEETDLNALKATIGAQPSKFLALVPKQSDVASQRTLAISVTRS